MHHQKNIFCYCFLTLCLISCAKKEVLSQSNKESNQTTTPPKNYEDIDVWLTQGDKSFLFKERKNVVIFNNVANQNATIEVDSTKKYQQIDGFGFCLTDGSAYLMNKMSSDSKAKLLKELFATDSSNIGISYIRVSIGASDLSSNVYTYDDMSNGQTDSTLTNFSIAEAKTDLIPILKQILAINPNIKILGSPWSAPSWMKDNNNSKGGSLLSKYYYSYANYFVKYIQSMQAAGIKIDAITPQNEPLNPNNNPSMYMTAKDEADFIKNALGPAFANAGITTKIIVYDHNCDVPQYPLTILNDADAAQYVDGSAFHLYAGDISALSTLHNSFPNKNVYFTEQYTPSSGSFSGDLSWAINNLIVGATQNWSKNVLEWNLASDPNLEPHTPGGCNTCLGAITIDGDLVTRNQSYYIIAHASKFVRPGSYRILSSSIANISSVAFLTPDGRKVLIALNTSNASQTFNIKYKGNIAQTSLNPGAVATYVW